MPTLTTEQQEAIRVLVNSMELTNGIGTKEAACSIAAINLALTGELTDEIPDCMSEVIGTWIITTQDTLPDQLRNSEQWKFLLPAAAGTGRELEAERVQILVDWFWESIVPEAKLIIENSFIKDNAVFMGQWEKALNGDIAMCEKAAMDVYLGVNNEFDIKATTATCISCFCRGLCAMLTELKLNQNPPATLPYWYKNIEQFHQSTRTCIATIIADAVIDLLRPIKVRAITNSLPKTEATNASVNKDEEELAFWQRINPAAVLKKLIDVTRT